MSNNYYEDELKQLQLALNDYALLYPEIANELHLNALQQKDPSVERLLEGVAYIASEMKRVAEDDYEEIYELIIEKNYPGFLQAIPSKTILQFNSIENQLHQTELIKSNFRVSSEEYLFATEFDCKVNPIRISNVEMIDRASLEIDISVTSPVNLNELNLGSLLMYLYSDFKNTHQYYWVFIHCLKQGFVYIDQKEISKGIYFTGYQKTSSKADVSKNIFVRIKDFFAFYQKNFFVEIHGLEQVQFPIHCRSFSLRFNFQHDLDQTFLFEQNSFRLNCVSAMNQFQTTTEPIHRINLQDEYPLIIDASKRGLELQKINEVRGYDLITNQNIHYQSFSKDDRHDSVKPYYQRINIYDLQGGKHHYLRLSNINKHDEVISCKVECSNGDEPFDKISIGSIQKVISSSSLPIKVQNITRPNHYVESRLSKKQLKFVLSLLFERTDNLFKVKQLKDILRLCCWNLTPQINKQIESIQDIQIEYQKMIYKGCFYDALLADIKMDEACFDSIGEISIWGEMFKEYFSEYLNVNTLLKLTITLSPSFKKIIWDPEPGRKCY